MIHVSVTAKYSLFLTFPPFLFCFGEFVDTFKTKQLIVKKVSDRLMDRGNANNFITITNATETETRLTRDV